jgi:hypothetical protein
MKKINGLGRAVIIFLTLLIGFNSCKKTPVDAGKGGETGGGTPAGKNPSVTASAQASISPIYFGGVADVPFSADADSVWSGNQLFVGSSAAANSFTFSGFTKDTTIKIFAKRKGMDFVASCEVQLKTWTYNRSQLCQFSGHYYMMTYYRQENLSTGVVTYPTPQCDHITFFVNDSTSSVFCSNGTTHSGSYGLIEDGINTPKIKLGSVDAAYPWDLKYNDNTGFKREVTKPSANDPNVSVKHTQIYTRY